MNRHVLHDNRDAAADRLDRLDVVANTTHTYIVVLMILIMGICVVVVVVFFFGYVGENVMKPIVIGELRCRPNKINVFAKASTSMIDTSNLKLLNNNVTTIE
jgi:hypothetical protein